MRTQALQKEYETIASKAAEIQQRGIYGDEVMLAGAAELTTYFTDTDAIDMMMDTLANYAAGMSLGEELDAQAMTDYATGLGKIMNGAYENMTRKGFTFTDAQKAVIEGTATQAQYIEVLGDEYLKMTDDVRSAAAITQVIDEYWANMYDTMSNTPQGKIIQLKNAFGDLKETVGKQLYPAVLAIFDIVHTNWPFIQNVVQGLTNGITVVLRVVGALLNGISAVANFFSDNWGIIQSIILGVAAALSIYNAALNAHAIYVNICSAATKAWGAIQAAFNAILAAYPLTWVAIVIGVIVAAVYLLCRRIAKTSEVANNAFSAMTGGINVVIASFKNLGLAVANIALGIWNAIDAICQNIEAAFHNALSNVQSWWYNLLSTALNVISDIAAALNKLPFVEFDYSGLTSKASEYAKKSAAAANNREEYTSVTDVFNKGMSTFDTFQKKWASNAFNAGAAWGNEISDKISSFFSGVNSDTNLFDLLGNGEATTKIKYRQI